MQENFLDNDFPDFSSPPTERWVKRDPRRINHYEILGYWKQIKDPSAFEIKKKKKDLELE